MAHFTEGFKHENLLQIYMHVLNIMQCNVIQLHVLQYVDVGLYGLQRYKWMVNLQQVLCDIKEMRFPVALQVLKENILYARVLKGFCGDSFVNINASH